ncbi:Acyl-coenzyme A thioesterase 11 [Quaeritorhiza haematococci]|nr:Acyl-coenzyme A thioesterase 11 [Quaeritorhiza haematococci]
MTEGKPVSKSRSVMTQMLRPAHADGRGWAYGGQVLAWIDICAAVAAKRHSSSPCVTASVDAVHFFSPARVGDMIVLKSTELGEHPWKSAFELNRKIWRQAYLTFVAMKDGKPTAVPPVLPETPAEHRRFAEADERRKARFVRKSDLKQPLRPISIRDDYTVSRTLSPSSPLAPTKNDQHDSKPKTRTPTDTFTEVIEIVFPEHANSLGITFGGQIMMWMESAAAMAASRFCRSRYITTAGMDSLSFRLPTHVGDMVMIRAIVTSAFTHSVEVYISVCIESKDGLTVTNDAYLTMVSVSEDVKPEKVPVLVTQTDEDVERQKGAAERRARRLAEKKELQKWVTSGKFN